MVFTFSTPVTSCGNASMGAVVSGLNPDQCTVNLSLVPNGQYTTVTLNGVVSSTGGVGNTTLAAAGVEAGVLTRRGYVGARVLTRWNPKKAAGNSRPYTGCLYSRIPASKICLGRLLFVRARSRRGTLRYAKATRRGVTVLCKNP
jgi:hypothetical protein